MESDPKFIVALASHPLPDQVSKDLPKDEKVRTRRQTKGQTNSHAVRENADCRVACPPSFCVSCQDTSGSETQAQAESQTGEKQLQSLPQAPVQSDGAGSTEHAIAEPPKPEGSDRAEPMVDTASGVRKSDSVTSTGSGGEEIPSGGGGASAGALTPSCTPSTPSSSAAAAAASESKMPPSPPAAAAAPDDFARVGALLQFYQSLSDNVVREGTAGWDHAGFAGVLATGTPGLARPIALVWLHDEEALHSNNDDQGLASHLKTMPLLPHWTTSLGSDGDSLMRALILGDVGPIPSSISFRLLWKAMLSLSREPLDLSVRSSSKEQEDRELALYRKWYVAHMHIALLPTLCCQRSAAYHRCCSHVALVACLPSVCPTSKAVRCRPRRQCLRQSPRP